ncbi:MAG: ethanolamine ammonia-lyase light chain EutC, partial [Acidobacteriaceae bacterium]
PVVGRTDADRNCLSNIRASGLAPEAAAARLLNLLDLARAMGRTGTFLKEGADGGRLESGPRQG